MSKTDFTPPPSSGVLNRRRRKQYLRGVGLVLAVALVITGLWWVKTILDQPVPVSSPCGPNLWLGTGKNPECVGVSDTSDFGLSELREARDAIRAENQRVLRGSPERPVVTVAVLTPVPVMNQSGKPSPVTTAQVRDKIEGAAVAQRSINRDAKGPEVRLVIANEGSQEQDWNSVVGQLKRELDHPEHPLVAVTGLGVSINQTLCGARSLSQVELPMVSSVLTADGLNAQGPLVTKYPQECGHDGIPGLFRVSPSNREEVEALAEYQHQTQPPDGRKYMPVVDSNDKDFYTYGLQQDFNEIFGDQIDHDLTQPFAGDSDRGAIAYQLGLVQNRICEVNGVLYSGRASMLPDFVQALGDVDCIRTGHRITVLTGSDAASLNPADVPPNVRITYAALADPQALASPDFNRNGVQRFADFQKEFNEVFPHARALDPSSPEGHLRSGWAIMQYDALMAIDAGIENATGGNQPLRPKGVRDVAGGIQAQKDPKRYAGDSFYFDLETGDPRGRAIHVVEINENRRQPVHAYPRDEN